MSYLLNEGKRVTEVNNSPLDGYVTMYNKNGIAVQVISFINRLQRQRITDFFKQSYSDKIMNRGYYYSITIIETLETEKKES